MLRRFRKRVPAEIYVFLVWHNALGRADDILTDLDPRFRILDIVEIEWSHERFAENLTRFYRDDLPPGSEKERHCGVGPFRLIVVEDPHPHHARRRTSRGRSVVNAHVFDARARYRGWTGGGHRIHASLTPKETDHDLFLLLGRTVAAYTGMNVTRHDGRIRRHAGDLLGAESWASWAELMAALEVTVDYVLLRDVDAGPGDPSAGLELLVENTWWAAVTANARTVTEATLRRYAVRVGGRELLLGLRSPEEAGAAHALLSEILIRRVRDDAGVFVPAPADLARLQELTETDASRLPG